MGKADSTRNADGTLFTVRAVSGLIGTELRVTHSTIKTAGGTLLWDGPHYGTRLAYMPGGGQLVPITNDEYASASTSAEARALALAFFADSYAATLKHAEAEGIPVRDCFA